MVDRTRTTRRAGIALIGAGIATAIPYTRGMSSTIADRSADVDTASDRSALLGVDPVASVQQGDEGVDLVTLTNNTDAALDVTVALEDPGQGSVSPSATTIASGASTTITITVASDSPTGTDALPFSVDATDGADLSISLTRAVDVTEGPSLKRYVTDQSANNTAQYQVQYTVENLPEFDRVEISFVSQDQSWASGSDSSTAREGQFSYSEGGAMGDTYDVTIEVYDSSNAVALEETITDVADGDDPSGNDDLSGPNDPTLESFTLYDDTQYNETEFTLEYEVSNTTNFEEVVVTFQSQDNSWASATETSASEPTGTVTYREGGTEGDTYEVTVEVRNTSGLTVDSGTITHVSGGPDSTSWP